MQNKNKLLLFLPALAALFAAVYMYFENEMLGFPDGHLTDLDKAMRVFYKITIPVNFIFSAAFILFSLTDRFNKRTKNLFLLCFGITIAIGIMIYYYLSSTLDNGIGG